jgi:hypothetical protein
MHTRTWFGEDFVRLIDDGHLRFAPAFIRVSGHRRPSAVETNINGC